MHLLVNSNFRGLDSQSKKFFERQKSKNYINSIYIACFEKIFLNF